MGEKLKKETSSNKQTKKGGGGERETTETRIQPWRSLLERKGKKRGRMGAVLVHVYTFCEARPVTGATQDKAPRCTAAAHESRPSRKSWCCCWVGGDAPTGWIAVLVVVVAATTAARFASVFDGKDPCLWCVNVGTST